jgi:hypothetical protein
LVGDLLGLDDLPPAALTPVLEAQESEGASGRALFAKLLTTSPNGGGSIDSLGGGGGEVLVEAVESDHAECAICFDDLCAESVAVFFDQPGPDGKRVCQHIFHCACCEGLKTCPLCNRDVGEWRELPDPIEKPKSWFAMVDFHSKVSSGDGQGKT